MQWIIRILFLFVYCLAWSSSYLKYDVGLNVVEIEVIEQASVNGKYVNLLHVIDAPEDKAVYGEFCDWGYSYSNTYAGKTNIEFGFWVYVYPKWYIWERLSAEDNLNPQASANGKYTVLLHLLKIPGDAHEYGSFYDWGFSEEYSYAGYENLTPGYWVYLEPNWYVWADIKNMSGGT